MRARLRHLILAVGIAALPACGGGASAPSPPSPSPASPGPSTPEGWVALERSPLSPNNGRHDDIFFIDPFRGWLVNTRGEVYRTEDGGDTWELASRLGDVTLRCVGFVSTQHGFAGNINFGTTRSDLALWETTDGGRSWANVSDRIAGAPVTGLCGMRVLSPAAVYAVGRWHGPPVFVKTTDGGRTWRSRSLAGLTSGLVDLSFFNEREGFAVGGLGDGPTEAEQRAARTVVLATADGGETWERRYASTSIGQRGWKILFVNDRVGFVSTEGASPEGVLLKTVDGGRTWTPIPVTPALSFEGIGFVSPERGWAAAFSGLYATDDGGASWRALNFGTKINRMRVINDGLVYAAGDRVYRWTR